MTPKELMIGDWVKFTSKYGYGTGQIAGIEPKEGAVEPSTFTIHKRDKDGNTKLFIGVSRTCVKPIPLTDEILKKNGFEYYHKNFASLSYDHPFRLKMVEWPDENGIGLWRMDGIIEIRFVHQLQHILNLIGYDKEIIL